MTEGIDMIRENILAGLMPVSECESACIFGGVDKGAQNALYTIGYVFGVIARFAMSIISRIQGWF